MRIYNSDNCAGVCPEAWAALYEANRASSLPYGEDEWTERVSRAFQNLFERECRVFLVSSGTAANALALSALCQPYHSVICAATAHVETNECSAFEFFSGGAKLQLVPASEGKLTPSAVLASIQGRMGPHQPKPRAVTISQVTETGLVYTLEEISELAAVCRAHGLKLHMDGARFANACAALARSPGELSWRSGVDVLCFGGTKNGLAIGEAIVFFDDVLAEDFVRRCKQAGQLASKMRFIAAPWAGLLESGAWLRNATHANACAARLASEVQTIPNVEARFPVETNAVFLSAHISIFKELRARGWQFHASADGSARFMFAWDTKPGDIDLLARDIRVAANAARSTWTVAETDDDDLARFSDN